MHRMGALAALAAGAAALTLLVGCTDQPVNGGQPQNLDAIILKAGGVDIRAEAAITPQQREIGLMYRHALRANGGMLFVFDAPDKQCFWMKNTRLPLDAAFISDDGTVVNVESMKPMTLDEHCSAWPVRYVLEMNQGWFASHEIKPGSKIEGLPEKAGTPIVPSIS